jgi:hypothetical protein
MLVLYNAVIAEKDLHQIVYSEWNIFNNIGCVISRYSTYFNCIIYIIIYT